MNDREIFAAAIKLTGDQRIAFLDAACGQDQSLRQQVDELLSAHEDSDGPLPFVNDREIEATQMLNTHAEAGTLIGPYKLLEEIGEGGMGSVWVAEQSKPIRRKVAIKLIKLGMDSKAVLARFEAERQALAMMDHPNIARVLDGGMTEQGRPYFAMEYVKGLPLIEYCDNAKLSVRERLELFMPICKAVQHAHQKGVIHRDLKPSNILVCLYDGKPVPKVIDFGLAKAMHQSLTNKTLHTAHGMMVGTPLYMSPEQAESNNLDVDTRTDIYSLGVILYELLTGDTPLEKVQLKDAAVAEILRLIKEVEPPKPSTRISGSQPNVAAQRRIEPGQLARSVSGDLDWVVMKALEKERSRRYETANGLAEDIRRHLADEPVSAGPPSARYRLQKFIRRNRKSVIAGSTVAIALVLGMVGTTAGLCWAKSEKAEAERQRARAERREDEAIDAVRSFGDTVANNAELKNRPELESLRKTLLEKPLAYFKSISQQLEQDADASPESLSRLAQAAFDLAKLTNEIGKKQNALLAYRQALEIWKGLARENPTITEYQYDISRAHTGIGRVLKRLSRKTEALAAYRHALDILEPLTRDQPNESKYQRSLGVNYYEIAFLHKAAGKPGEALEAFQESQGIFERLVRKNPSEYKSQNGLASTYQGLATWHSHQGKHEEALVALRQALAIFERLAEGQHSDPTFRAIIRSNLGIVHGEIGDLLARTGKTKDAAKAVQMAIQIWERLNKEYPTVTDYQSRLGERYRMYATYLKQMRRLPESQEAYEQALTNYSQLVTNHPDIPSYQLASSRLHMGIAELDSRAGRPKEASQHYQLGVEMIKQLTDKKPENLEYQNSLAANHYNFGIFLARTGKPEEAVTEYQKALVIQKRLVQKNPDVADYLGDLAATLNNMTNLEESTKDVDILRDQLVEAIQYQKRAIAADPRNPRFQQHLASHYRSLLFVLVKAERWNEAAEFGRQFIDQNPNESTWLTAAPFLVLNNDKVAYAKFCEGMVSQFGDLSEGPVADRVCKACLLMPKAINPQKLPGRVLAGVLDGGTDPDWFLPWGWGTRALLAYRSGDAQLAIRYANEAERHKPLPMAHALNLAVLAMAQHEAGDREAAEHALNELSQIVGRQHFQRGDYENLLIARILLKEAEAKVNKH